MIACESASGELVVTYSNDVFKSMLGLGADQEVVGAKLFALIGPLLSEPARKEFFVGIGKRRRVLVRLKQDSEYWPNLRLFLRPVEGNAWSGSLVLVDDELDASTDSGVSIESAVIDRFELRSAGSEAAIDRASEEQIVDLSRRFEIPGCLFELVLTADDRFELPFLAGEIAGFDLAAFKRRPEVVFERIEAEDAATVRSSCLQAAGTLDVWHCDFRILGAEADVRWLLIQARPSREPDGSVRFTGFALDVTSRKFAEQALEESKDRYRNVVDDQNEVICRFDRTGKLEFVNYACVKLIQRSIAELVGTSWFELLAPASRALIGRRLGELSPDDPFLQEELRVAPEPSHWFQWTIRAFFTEARELVGYQAVGRDIQPIKELEHQIREVSHREQKRIGHDLHDGLGQELTGISLMLKTLEHDAAHDAPELAARVGSIHAMVGHCIANARALAQGLSPVHLDGEGFAGALSQLASNIQSLYRIPIEFEHPSLVALKNEETATDLYRIVQEALTNASKHSRATRISLRLTVDNTGLVVEIEDDGIGIAAAAENNRGMGLKIMRYRANIIGASLNITSGSEGGTLFRCRLPAAAMNNNTGGAS